MIYTRLGNTGLEVSRICLGCMSYGVPERGMHPWSLDEDSSRPLIRKALELGINFLDTANVYSDGTSRGDRRPRAQGLRQARRDRLATKVHGRMRAGPERRRPVAQGDLRPRSTTACAGSAPITSTSIRSTAGTTRRRSRRRSKRSTTS